MEIEDRFKEHIKELETTAYFIQDKMKWYDSHEKSYRRLRAARRDALRAVDYLKDAIFCLKEVE